MARLTISEILNDLKDAAKTKVKLVNGTNEAYVIWLGSNDDSVLNNEVIDIGSKTIADRIDYVDGVATGNSTSLTVTNNTVTVNITEKPFIILAS